MKWLTRESGGTVLLCGRPTSRLARFAIPPPHAPPAAVLGDKLDAGGFQGGDDLREVADHVGGRRSPRSKRGSQAGRSQYRDQF
jgi:hypothetical protein